MTLGGSMFIHNGKEFDYCVAESLASLCAVCDSVVALDASSTDGTTELLLHLETQYPNLKVITGVPWDCANNFDRLRILADMAKSFLNTDWHFMLQGDEVIHESSFPFIREAIRSKTMKSFMVRRCNLFGDMNHYLGYDIPHADKPVSDRVIRLATINNCAYGDAESLKVDPVTLDHTYLDKIIIFHYGFVRRDENSIQKVLSMQSWFWGPDSQPDVRVVEMSKKGTRFEWEKLKRRELLFPLTMTHPRFSQSWAEERQKEKIPVV